MGAIYQTSGGDSVYDSGGVTYNAKTGQQYTAPSTSTPTSSTQTDAQRAAAMTAAGLSSGQKTAVVNGTPYVSDSSSVVAGENNTMNSLSSLFGQTPDIKLLMENSKNSVAEIEARQKALEERRMREEETINKQYEGERAAQSDAQNRETGATNVALTTKLGGYLGSSGSATGAVNNLAAQHRTEMLALDSKRDAAIQAARNAVEDKDFALARMKSDEIKSLSADIYQRQQDFFGNALKLQAEQRAGKDQNAQDVKNILDGIGEVAKSGIDVTLDGEKASMIDSYYGVPGFAAAYAQAQNKAARVLAAKNTVDAQKAKFETMKSYVDLVSSVPVGMKIPFGDETIVGIGKTSDYSTFHVEDKDGNVRVVNYNTGNGSYTMTNLGKVGTGSTTTDSANASLSKYQQYLVPGQKLPDGTAVLDINGYANPTAWKQLIEDARTRGVPRDQFIKQYGYLMFPDGIKEYGLTPAERTLIEGS